MEHQLELLFLLFVQTTQQIILHVINALPDINLEMDNVSSEHQAVDDHISHQTLVQMVIFLQVIMIINVDLLLSSMDQLPFEMHVNMKMKNISLMERLLTPLHIDDSHILRSCVSLVCIEGEGQQNDFGLMNQMILSQELKYSRLSSKYWG